jgi:hypothetical protein
MDQEPLVTGQIVAGWKLLQEFNQQRPVDLAFWGRSSENGRWLLYIASDLSHDKSMQEIYRELHRVLGPSTDFVLDSSEVRLIGVDHPAAETAREIIQSYPGRFSHGANLGVESDRIRFRLYGIDQAYIYKPLSPVAAT